MNWQPGMTLEDIEKRTILEALRFYRGNKTQTASALGITAKTLYNKLETYEVRDEGKEQRRLIESGNSFNAQKGPERKPGESLSQAEKRNAVEPVAQLPAQQSVHMREQQEVQEVSSAPTRSRRR